MGLEDIASLRADHGSTVLHPCDANETATLVEALADTDAIGTSEHSGGDAVIYPPDEEFEIGGAASCARATTMSLR